MKRIAIAGAGGFAKEVYLIIREINKIQPTWHFIGFFDDKVKKGKLYLDFEVLGTIREINDDPDDLCVAIAAGKSDNIRAIKNQLVSEKLHFPNLIHPGAIVHNDSLKIGAGNIFQIQSCLSADNTIGNFNLFNAGVKVGHDTVIGDYNIFGTGALISGGVTVGNANDFGMGSGVLQYKKVGNNNTVSPLSMLYRSVKDDGHYLGNPAMPTGL